MLNIFKYIFLPLAFSLSCYAVANENKIVMWECIFCKRIFVGERPPVIKKCIKFPHPYDIWDLKSVTVTTKFLKV